MLLKIASYSFHLFLYLKCRDVLDCFGDGRVRLYVGAFFIVLIEVGAFTVCSNLEGLKLISQ